MNPKQINFSRSFLVCCIYSLIGRLSELEWVCCGVRNENRHVDWAVYSVLSELSLPLVTGGALQLARVFDSFGRSGKVSAVCVRLFFGWMCDFWVVAGELASSPFRPGVCECVCVCVCANAAWFEAFSARLSDQPEIPSAACFAELPENSSLSLS